MLVHLKPDKACCGLLTLFQDVENKDGKSIKTQKTLNSKANMKSIKNNRNRR